MKRLRLVFPISLTLIVLCIGQAAQAQGVDADLKLDDVDILLNTINWGGMLTSIVVIFLAGLLLRIANNLVLKLGEMFAERRLLLQKINAFLRFGVYIATIVIVIFLSFELSREVIAIIGGGTAVAIGFASKDLVASLAAGMMIIVDRPFQAGDRVSFEGHYGDITKIGLRSVKLQTLDDSTITIPNNLFLNSVTSCGNYGVLDMQVVIDFHIGLDQNAQLASDLIREAAATSLFVYLPKPIVVLVSQVILEQCIALRLRLKLYVLDTQYEKALETDVTLRVMDAFANHVILPPAVLHRNFDNLKASS
ncbi:MAG TPA: mechanosensitive ion channel domain-containing protein [Gammaproteobacteria bacterium]|nr:mechanosensitive ion channel domain-containing protein [Gammaproteobacteria bacterium]